jgi:hypothetical protein
MSVAPFIRARSSLPLLFLLACCGQAMAQDKHIDVAVQERAGGFKLVFLNSECPDRPSEKGCIEAAHGSSPNISWELDDASNATWQLNRLQFSPDGVHWGDPGHPLADCTVKDFNLTPAEQVSGHASIARSIANGKRLMIKDDNTTQCRTHYRLFAVPAGGGTEIDSDPIIDNRGGSN